MARPIRRSTSGGTSTCYAESEVEHRKAMGMKKAGGQMMPKKSPPPKKGK